MHSVLLMEAGFLASTSICSTILIVSIWIRYLSGSTNTRLRASHRTIYKNLDGSASRTSDHDFRAHQTRWVQLACHICGAGSSLLAVLLVVQSPHEQSLYIHSGLLEALRFSSWVSKMKATIRAQPADADPRWQCFHSTYIFTIL